ncbi:anti-sigma factor [uncultured Sphingomonas sp.]|uniref:anti-sigma factor family protein n=1 Tax=uncultured Sphingomonas sp. TaxID=158754 RepID=UPI0025D7FE74|nr:anti-sigma factor [uncultured Sphingomonas sp.]
MSIDPELLMAYADGELGPLDAKRVEQAIAADPALGAEVARHRALRARLDGHFAAVAQEPVPDRLAALIRTNVVDLPARRRTARVPAWAPWSGAVAAALVLGLLLGKGLPEQGVVRTRDGHLYAAGSLAGALDRQLAANAGDVQLVVSFRDREGRYCRVFRSQPADGIACHEAKGWALRQTMGGSRVSARGYAQAGSADAALMAAAQELMAGDPLDAAAEARARAAGWK